MPSFNQAAFIEESISSILQQDYPNLELIVADGGSQDGTLALLERLQSRDARLKWFSRRDKGPAEALNNALVQARGTIIGWLNSDDLYSPGAVRRAVDALAGNPSWMMVYGHGQHVDAAGKTIDLYPTLQPSTPVEYFNNGCFICQPTVFFRRTMPVLLGKLDEGLKASFDFDYWLRAFLAFPGRIGFVDALQASSRLHEACITRRMRRVVAMEGMKVLARHFGHAPGHWLLSYMEELLAAEPSDTEVPDLRAHLEAAIDEAAAWMTPQSLDELKARIGKDSRLDRSAEGGQVFPNWGEGTNALVPEWQDTTFGQAISLGSFCHAATVLKQCGFRRFSGPFDWIFSKLEVTAHALQDDFSLFLDPDQYEPVPEEKRVVVEANLCDHRFYRDRFGQRFMFNHHLPSTPRDYAYLQRCVERFRAAMASSEPKLLLLVTQQPVTEAAYKPLLSALDALSGSYLLLVVRFCLADTVQEESGDDLRITRHARNFITMDFPVIGLSNGVEFPDSADNDRFLALMKSFRVREDATSALSEPQTAAEFDESWYLETYPDVAQSVRNGRLRSGWDHYTRHGRTEGRRARTVV